MRATRHCSGAARLRMRFGAYAYAAPGPRTRTTCTSHDARSPSTRYTHDARFPLPRDVTLPFHHGSTRNGAPSDLRSLGCDSTTGEARSTQMRQSARSFSASSTTHAVAAASPTATAVRATPPAKPADVAGGASVADAEDVDGAEVATPRGRAALRAAARASRLRTAIGRSR